MPPNEKLESLLLPKDLMEVQIGQVDLLLAMYSSDDAVSMDDESSAMLTALRSWCEGDAEKPPEISDTSIAMMMTLALDDPGHSSSSSDLHLQLDLSVPLTCQDGEQDLTEPPKVKVRVRQPAWMSRADLSRLSSDIPDEDMLTIIEHVKEAASQYLVSSSQTTDGLPTAANEEAIVRAWFYFPSISTRSKRDDLINHGPAYGLTGFLMAGKPGILCLEGGPQAIDDYMKFIKTESWGDIPPQHKKVSERYRETKGVERAFKKMQEITDSIGERRGERANRNDMKALEAWLKDNGVGEAFSKVLI
jgi:hypothetical protein